LSLQNTKVDDIKKYQINCNNTCKSRLVGISMNAEPLFTEKVLGEKDIVENGTLFL